MRAPSLIISSTPWALARCLVLTVCIQENAVTRARNLLSSVRKFVMLTVSMAPIVVQVTAFGVSKSDLTERQLQFIADALTGERLSRI